MKRLVIGIGLGLVFAGQALHAQPKETDRQVLVQLRAKAEKGDADSQLETGQAFSQGRYGLATNCVEAVKWWRQAAEQNQALAQFNLGVCYRNGDGVTKDEVEAYKWYLLAAAQGDNKARRNASMLELLLSREEIAEDKRRAEAWLEQRKTTSLSPR